MHTWAPFAPACPTGSVKIYSSRILRNTLHFSPWTTSCSLFKMYIQLKKAIFILIKNPLQVFYVLKSWELISVAIETRIVIWYWPSAIHWFLVSGTIETNEHVFVLSISTLVFRMGPPPRREEKSGSYSCQPPTFGDICLDVLYDVYA